MSMQRNNELIKLSQQFLNLFKKIFCPRYNEISSSRRYIVFCELLSTRPVSSHPVRWVEGRVKENRPRKGKLLNLWTRSLIVRFAITKNHAKSKWTKVETWGKCIVVFALSHFKRLQAFYQNQLTYITTGLTPVKQLIDNGWLLNYLQIVYKDQLVCCTVYSVFAMVKSVLINLFVLYHCFKLRNIYFFNY